MKKLMLAIAILGMGAAVNAQTIKNSTTKTSSQPQNKMMSANKAPATTTTTKVSTTPAHNTAVKEAPKNSTATAKTHKHHKGKKAKHKKMAKSPKK